VQRYTGALGVFVHEQGACLAGLTGQQPSTHQVEALGVQHGGLQWGAQPARKPLHEVRLLIGVHFHGVAFFGHINDVGDTCLAHETGNAVGGH